MERKDGSKVSIIVPAYNAERYIGECIDSLIRQTYKNIEIILVDDGSVDTTGAVCEEYRRRYQPLIQVIDSEHCGVTNARLKGVQKAVGEYLAFVDADDWIEKDYIASMFFCMDGADMIAAGISREQMGEDGSIFCEYNGIVSGMYVSEGERKKLYEKMLYCASPYQFGVLPYLCNKIFRKALMQPFLESVDKRIFDGEDVAVVYPYLLAAEKIVLTDDCKYHYRNHGDSASFRDFAEAYWNASCLYQTLYAYFEKSEYRKSLMEQLDYYMCRIIWKKDPAAYLSVNSFLFPFGKVKAESRIILYGMGKMGAALYYQLKQTNYCRLSAWADRNPRKPGSKTASVPYIFPWEIMKYPFDYVIIAIQNEMIAAKAAKELSAMGIAEQKIIRA